MMTIDDIQNLLQFGEHLTLECKKAKGGVPNSVWETYSAFANTRGGTILLGVSEDLDAYTLEDRFSIDGVENPEKIIKDFWDTINNANKVNLNILKDEDVESVAYQDVTVIVINVPQAEYGSRPIYINNNPKSGTFKRNNEGDYHCTEQELRFMYRDAFTEGQDGDLLEGFTMEDLDAETIRSYRQVFTAKNDGHNYNGRSNEDFLKRMGAMVVDRKTGKEWLTVAGLLMFGKSEALRERFPNFRMDYLDKTNLVGKMRWSDRLTDDGRWENNLYNFYSLVFPKLTFGLKRPFQQDADSSRTEETKVHDAVREAFTNAIIHADYFLEGILKVEKLENGFAFSNPGLLRLPVNLIYQGNYSKARNPILQKMFRMIGNGENIGSGWPTILDAWKENNWRKPILKDRHDVLVVELQLDMVSLVSDELAAEIQQVFGDEFNRLNRDEQLVVVGAMQTEGLSNQDLQPILEVNSLDVRKVLLALVNKHFLTVNPNGRWTTYSANREFNVGGNVGGNVGENVGGNVGENVGGNVGGNVGRNVGRNVGGNVGGNVGEVRLTSRRKKILTALKESPSVSAKTMADLFSVTSRTIERDLAYLQQKQIIKRIGEDKGGQWIVVG